MFRKILLWSLGLLIFSSAAYLATAYWFGRSAEFNQDLGRRILEFMTDEAIQSYERGGRAELAATLARYNQKFPAQHRLLDSSGRDLVTGEDLRPFLKQAEKGPQFQLPPPKRFFFRQVSSDGRYAFLVEVRPTIDLWSNLAVYGWIVVVVVLMSYALAWSLAKPVRALRNTMIRFGRGDLSSRYPSKRRDEIGDLARSFNQMAERIETLLTAERRLLQDVSHELRSPLTRLRFALALAKSGPDPASAFAQLEKEVNRLAALVDELLQMTRAEGDPEARHFSPVQLNSLVHSIVEDSRLESEARGCEVRLTADGTITCMGEPDLLRRGVENVLRNAIQYTAPGTVVDVHCFEQNGQAVIEVRDHGPGIPETALEDIFRPFFRVDDDRNRDTGGVGLGLAIAPRAVRLHQGQIRARNMNPGLLIEIRLPLA